jgi:glucokinase
VAVTGDLLLEPATASFARHLFGAAHRPHVDVVLARLGPDAGWIGGALLALDNVTSAVPPLLSR